MRGSTSARSPPPSFLAGTSGAGPGPCHRADVCTACPRPEHGYAAARRPCPERTRPGIPRQRPDPHVLTGTGRAGRSGRRRRWHNAVGGALSDSAGQGLLDQ